MEPGLYGLSTLRIFDISTGRIVKVQPLPRGLFGEGVAVFPDCLIQITWKEETACIYDRLTLKLLGEMHYEGEGWGLCSDGETVWMSDGTSFLTQRDKKTFEPIKTLLVTMNGAPLNRLNDLECVGEYLYANVWMTSWIVRINKATGIVDGVIDASSLLTKEVKKMAGRKVC